MSMYPTYPTLTEQELAQTVTHIVDFCVSSDTVQEALDVLHHFLGHDLNNQVLVESEKVIVEHYYQLHELDKAEAILKP